MLKTKFYYFCLFILIITINYDGVVLNSHQLICNNNNNNNTDDDVKSNNNISMINTIFNNKTGNPPEPYTIWYDYLTRSTNDFNESVTIGFLGAYGQTQVVLGALPLAIDAVNANAGTYLILNKSVIRLGKIGFISLLLKICCPVAVCTTLRRTSVQIHRVPHAADRRWPRGLSA